MSLSGYEATIDGLANELVERILGSLDGLTQEQLDATPPGETSSLLVIAGHAIAAVEWNLVQMLAGGQVDRNRAAEFEARAADAGDAAGVVAVLRERWDDAHANIRAALEGLDGSEYAAMKFHPFLETELSGQEFVVRALAHTAEHVGHAEITRQWLDNR